MYRRSKLELCAWLVLGPALMWFIQYTACLEGGKAVTWEKLLLSGAVGFAGGWFAWSTQIPLRWWLYAYGCAWYVATRWHVLFGGVPLDQRYPVTLEMYCLWAGSGILGAFLYSRWLSWRYAWEYDEGLTLYLCLFGAYLGWPLLLWGSFRCAQRLVAWRHAQLFFAWKRLYELDDERAQVVGYIVRRSRPRAEATAPVISARMQPRRSASRQ